MMKLREKTTATLLMVLLLASITAIAVPAHADTIDHTEHWNPFTIRSQDVENRMGVVSVVISGLAVSGDLYVGNTLTLSGTVDMKADSGIHAWWIHEAWACSWGSAALTGPGVHEYYESPLKWADGYILSGWWWNIIPNDQSQKWDFSFNFIPTQTGTYTLKAFGHADAGYWRQHYDSEHPGWSWKRWLEDDDSITFDVTVMEATVDIAPDTLNLKSNGQYITAYITLPDGYMVENIDPDSVYLGEIKAAWSEIQDGVFMAKFDRSSVQGAMKDVDGYEEDVKFQDVTLTVTGKVAGVPFVGSDTVKVITK